MKLGNISKAVRRVDAIEKSEGKAKFISDYCFKDCLWARMIRSSVPRGIIKKINLPELPKGYDFVSYKDIPKGGENCLNIIEKDWKCFAENEVKFVGETIGLLVGPDITVLQNLLDQVKIDYEEQEGAFSIEEGLCLKGGAQLKDDNIHCKLQVHVGNDVDEVFKACDKIVEETFETGFQEHIYLETNGACCIPEGDRFIIYASAQCPFNIKVAVAPILNINPDNIVIRQTTTGGGFGGKENFPDVLCGPLLVAANKLRKGVKMFFDRDEDIEFSVKRHPSKVTIKTGLDKSGSIKAMDTTVLYNAGAYLSSSFVVLQRGCFHATGVYSFPNIRVTGKSVFTNTYPSCAFRGFGGPQVLFAIETHMNHLAQIYGLDPLEFKNKYLIKQGDLTPTNGKIIEKVVLSKMEKQVVKASDYWRKAKEYKIGSGKGIGIAFYNHGAAFTGNGEAELIKAKLKLHKYADGTVKVLCSQTEMGQGFHTVLPKIVAKTLNIPINKVVFDNPDTSVVPDSGPTVASRSTMIVGELGQRAALLMKSRYKKEDDFEIEVSYQHPEGYPWDQDTLQGYAYLGYGWGVCVVEVEVDQCTGEVTTKGIWTSHDPGHVMDELICHGQVNGGVLQGIGWASTEVMENKDGYFKQTNMSTYVVPTSMDYPTQEVFFVENPYQWGPYGAKGMGELVFGGGASAYIDAVSRAIGKKINSIPVPTEKVMYYMLHGEDL